MSSRWLVVVLAAASVTAVGAVAMFGQRPQPVPADPPGIVDKLTVVAPPDRGREPQFKAVLIACGKNANTGSSFCATAYEDEQGTRLNGHSETYPSRSKAHKAFTSVIADATRVVRSGPLCDASGRLIGDRALLLQRARSGRGAETALVYRVDANVRSVVSASMEDVLAFEDDSSYSKACAAGLREAGEPPAR